MKKLFIFGAGASKAAGNLPLGRDLVWDYFEGCSCLYRIEYGKTAEIEVREIEREYKNYERFLSLVDELFPELNEVEKLNKCIRNAEFYQSPVSFPTYTNKKYYVDDVLQILIERKRYTDVRLIKQLILEHLTKAGIGSDRKLYSNFFKKYNKDVSVITFNFDTLIVDKNYEDPWRFSYLINFDSINKNCKDFFSTKDGIPIIKLNGSLDWAECQECGKISLLDPFVSVRNYSNLKCDLTKNCSGRMMPLIVLPHHKAKKKMSSLYEKAKHELTTAEEITIIGYSFPYYDIEIIELFRENINPNVKLKIVDSIDLSDFNKIQEEKIERAKRLIEVLSLKHTPSIEFCGFEKYLENC